VHQTRADAGEQRHSDRAEHRTVIYGATVRRSSGKASAHALDLARSGQDERAWEALRQAWTIGESVEQTSDELAGPFSCSLDRASGGFWSETQLALGSADVASDQADRAVDAFEATPPQQRNLGSERMVRLLKARAHLSLGQLHDVEDALTPVLDTSPGHRARPLLARMDDVRHAVVISPYAADPIALRIRSAVQGFQEKATMEDLSP
jgi:hypothetical protein